MVLDDRRSGSGSSPVSGPFVGITCSLRSSRSTARSTSSTPTQFDVVIVDEFHHAEADTYRRLLEHLKPKVLLGLTATPERADGKEILHWFDERIASEMRLWEALDQGSCVRSTTWASATGRPARRRLPARPLRHLRARRRPHRRPRPGAADLESVKEWVLDPTKMRALGFLRRDPSCAVHGGAVQRGGLPSVALDGDTRCRDPARGCAPASTRRAPSDLHRRHLQRGRRHPGGRHDPAPAADGERDRLPAAARPWPSLGRGQERPDGARLHRPGARGLPLRH